MENKHRQEIKLATSDGVFLVKMEEVSRKRLTTKDDLIKEITLFIKQTINDERGGVVHFSLSPEHSLARRIADFLEDRGWFIPIPIVGPKE